MNQGPPIEELTRHLAECPESFLGEPVQSNGTGSVHVGAVISDLLLLLKTKPLNSKQLKKFSYGAKKRMAADRNRLRLALVCCWLGYSASISEAADGQKFLALLESLDGLAALVPAEQFVTDAERREELARLLLRGLELLPAGEGEEEAENRFDSVSTVKRDSVVKAAQEAEIRARKIREELARKERERRAASVYSHE